MYAGDHQEIADGDNADVYDVAGEWFNLRFTPNDSGASLFAISRSAHYPSQDVDPAGLPDAAANRRLAKLKEAANRRQVLEEVVAPYRRERFMVPPLGEGRITHLGYRRRSRVTLTIAHAPDVLRHSETSFVSAALASPLALPNG